MIKEELITWPTAVLAREVGFNALCRICFNGGCTCEGDVYTNHNQFSGYTSRPSQSLLARWIREKHQLHVYVEPSINTYIQWSNGVVDLSDFREIIEDCENFNNLELALESGLLAALEYIKQQNNEIHKN